jgi:hypothetical protein
LNIIYDGYIGDGEKHGHGKMKSPNGSFNTGKRANNMKDSKGMQVFKSCYIGEWKYDKKYGNGIEKNFFGYVGIKVYMPDEYDGQWKNDMKHGKGKFTNKDGDVYEGEWFNDKKHGKGKLVFKNDGSVYNGEWDNDKRHGKGTFTLPNGDSYYGQWKNNKSHGEGTFTYSDGNKYVGEWIEGQKHGKGTYTWSNGHKYVGEWKENEKDGKGTYIYSEGHKYVGEWKKNKKHGKGTYTWSNGNKYVGEYNEDIKHGKGTFTSQNISYVGIWQNNIPDRGKYYIGEKNYIKIDSEKDKFNPILTFIIKNGNYNKTYTIKCKYKYNKNNSVKYIKNILRIKGGILSLGAEIIDFCNKICNFIKFQGICKRYLIRKKFDFVLKELIFNNPSIKIQKYFRGYRIRNIFHRCYNRKNSSCPFKIISKFVPIRTSRIIRSKIIKEPEEDLFNNFNLHKDRYKVISPKRKDNNYNNGSKNKGKKNNKNTSDTNQNKISYKKGIKNVKVKTTGKNKKSRTKKNYIKESYDDHLKLVDGNTVKRFPDGSYAVINNETGQYTLYDKDRNVQREFNKKCFVNPYIINLFLNKVNTTVENYIYIDCHGLTKEELKLKILNTIDNKSDIVDSIILNVGKGYHINYNGEKLILKKFIYELESRFINSNINKDSFFNNYPENTNFFVKQVYKKNLCQKRMDQLLCICLL